MIKYVMILLSISLINCKAQELNKAYSKFDFIPGDSIIYYRTFQQDALGEIPNGWNTNGSAEVVNINNKRWVKLLQNATFITDNAQHFTNNYTIEFDLLLDYQFQNALFPPFSFGLFSSGNAAPNSNTALQNIFLHQLVALDVHIGQEQNSLIKLISFQKANEYFNSGEKPFKQIENMLQQTIHVSMQIQNQRLRIWLNEHKIIDIPQAIPAESIMNQLFFRTFESSYNNQQIGVYVSDIVVAKGISEFRNKFLTTGKFSSSRIVFDVNEATIKPTSHGILKEIATVINQTDSIKVMIVGHTDNDGSSDLNLILSKKRSEAVKNYLVNVLGVSASKILTDGKGASEPITNNASSESKAQNRRVEFIKL